MPRHLWIILLLFGVGHIVKVYGGGDLGETCSSTTSSCAGVGAFCQPTNAGGICACGPGYTNTGELQLCRERKTCTEEADCESGFSGGDLNSGETLVCFEDPGGDGSKRCTAPDDLPDNPIPDGFVGGYCAGNNTECCDKNAECDTDMTKVCKCKEGYRSENGVCVKDGLVGQTCEANMPCGKNDDKNAVCVPMGDSYKCKCKAGTALVGSMCLQNGRLGGCCDGDGSMCTKDKNAQCNPLGICECKDGSSPRNGMCIKDGSPGGLCIGGLCSGDVMSECDTATGRCKCKAETSLINGACIENERVNGRCSQANGMKCEKEKFGICLDGMCMCAVGSYTISGSCVIDGSNGGRCYLGKPCVLDKYAECVDVGITPYGMCMCKNGSHLYSGFCRPDGRVNGMCLNGACPNDKFAMCVDDWCVCKDGSKAIGGWCRLDNKAGGYCSTADNTTCSGDKHADCINNMCMCRTNTYSKGGMCRPDGSIGGRCCEDSRCFAKNSECVKNMCLCEVGYSQIDGKCKTAADISRRVADTEN